MPFCSAVDNDPFAPSWGRLKVESRRGKNIKHVLEPSFFSGNLLIVFDVDVDVDREPPFCCFGSGGGLQHHDVFADGAGEANETRLPSPHLLPLTVSHFDRRGKVWERAEINLATRFPVRGSIRLKAAPYVKCLRRGGNKER